MEGRGRRGRITQPTTSSYSFWALSGVLVLKSSFIQELGDGIRVKKQLIKVSCILWEAKGPSSILKAGLLYSKIQDVVFFWTSK